MVDTDTDEVQDRNPVSLRNRVSMYDINLESAVNSLFSHHRVTIPHLPIKKIGRELAFPPGESWLFCLSLD